MAKTLSKTGITDGSTIQPPHVTQSIDAFTGTEAYDISLSGSLTLTGSYTSIGDITASGNISASGNIIATEVTASKITSDGGSLRLGYAGSNNITIENTADLFINAPDGTIEIESGDGPIIEVSDVILLRNSDGVEAIQVEPGQTTFLLPVNQLISNTFLSSSNVITTEVTASKITAGTGTLTLGNAGDNQILLENGGDLFIDGSTGTIEMYGGTSELVISDNGFQFDASITASGNISSSGTIIANSMGVGYSPDPSFKLDVSGSARITDTLTVNTTVYTSQADLKEQISGITKTKAKVIEFKEYQFKSDSEDRKRYGVLAEDIEDDYPELVYTGPDGVKGVNYIDLLVKRVAELEKELADISVDNHLSNVTSIAINNISKTLEIVIDGNTYTLYPDSGDRDIKGSEGEYVGGVDGLDPGDKYGPDPGDGYVDGVDGLDPGDEYGPDPGDEAYPIDEGPV